MPEKSVSAKTYLLPCAVAVGVIAIWAVLSARHVFPASIFPSPGAVLAGFGEEIRSGRLVKDIIASQFRVTVGFALAVALGIPCGLWLGNHAPARAALLPAVNFFRSLSPLAWIPFAILWFGIGDAPAVFLTFMATFFPLVLATIAAVASIPTVYFRVAQEYGMSGREVLMEVTLPAIMPQIITALRVTAGVAWLVVVAAEMPAARDGLGFAIWDARNGLRMDLLVAGMIVIGIIGMIIDRLIVQLTKLPGVRWGYER
ncbi:MAG TPA: ABC transporter permease [Abditibacteriaceae bacterium]|nr:ABC transporter permease [Abditibacteriaceae bacterium]